MANKKAPFSIFNAARNVQPSDKRAAAKPKKKKPAAKKTPQSSYGNKKGPKSSKHLTKAQVEEIRKALKAGKKVKTKSYAKKGKKRAK